MIKLLLIDVLVYFIAQYLTYNTLTYIYYNKTIQFNKITILKIIFFCHNQLQTSSVVWFLFCSTALQAVKSHLSTYWIFKLFHKYHLSSDSWWVCCIVQNFCVKMKIGIKLICCLNTHPWSYHPRFIYCMLYAYKMAHLLILNFFT